MYFRPEQWKREKSIVFKLLHKFRHVFKLEQVTIGPFTKNSKRNSLYHFLIKENLLRPETKLKVELDVKWSVDPRIHCQVGQYPTIIFAFDFLPGGVIVKENYSIFLKSFENVVKMVVIDYHWFPKVFDLGVLSLTPNLTELTCHNFKPIKNLTVPNWRELDVTRQDFFEGFEEYLCTTFPNLEHFMIGWEKNAGRELDFTISVLPQKCFYVSTGLS